MLKLRRLNYKLKMNILSFFLVKTIILIVYNLIQINNNATMIIKTYMLIFSIMNIIPSVKTLCKQLTNI